MISTLNNATTMVMKLGINSYKAKVFTILPINTISWINGQKITNGILNINILHTSASLVIQENADPDVLHDLKNFFDKIVPMDNKLYKHTTEGKDDMPAHHKVSSYQQSTYTKFKK